MVAPAIGETILLNGQYSLPESFGGICKQAVYPYTSHTLCNSKKSRFQRRLETAFIRKFHKNPCVKVDFNDYSVDAAYSQP